MSADIFGRVLQVLDTIKSSVIENEAQLEAFRIKYLGSKNELKELFGEIKNVDNDRKKEFGQLLNDVKKAAEDKYEELNNNLVSNSKDKYQGDIDLSAPCEPIAQGSRHPVSIVMNRIIQIFERIGFIIAEEREIEDDWYNFLLCQKN